MFKVSSLFQMLFAAAMPAYAFDPKDPADIALLDERIAAAVEPLHAHNKKLLGELKAAKKGAEIDPAVVEALEAERDGLAAKLKDADKALKTATTAAEQAAEALKGEQGFNHGLLVDNGLMAALTEAGVKNPVHLKAAAAILKQAGGIEVKVDGATRQALIGGKPLAEAVKAWAAGDEGKTFVQAPGNGGGGAPGSTGGASGAPKPTAGNMGGTPAERTAAIASMFPELATQT